MLSSTKGDGLEVLEMLRTPSWDGYHLGAEVAHREKMERAGDRVRNEIEDIDFG